MSTTGHSKAPFASTFPGRYYYDPAIYALEQARIFGKMWVYTSVAIMPGHMDSMGNSLVRRMSCARSSLTVPPSGFYL